jgi:signal transduction histidine kinase
LKLDLKDRVPEVLASVIVQIGQQYVAQQGYTAEVTANDMWSIHSYAGDYNPLHDHGGNTPLGLSSILYLKVPPVIANADRVEQLLVILLDNAIKYTPEGGTISVDATWDDARVTLSVRDTGIGIAPEDLPFVFDRFYKVDKAHSGMGSGLGLSIAKELLRWMGEDIWAKSEKGAGSEFGFTIKRDRSEA